MKADLWKRGWRKAETPSHRVAMQHDVSKSWQWQFFLSWQFNMHYYEISGISPVLFSLLSTLFVFPFSRLFTRFPVSHRFRRCRCCSSGRGSILRCEVAWITIWWIPHLEGVAKKTCHSPGEAENCAARSGFSGKVWETLKICYDISRGFPYPTVVLGIPFYIWQYSFPQCAAHISVFSE